jgi:AcrR family transcriptional regulator
LKYGYKRITMGDIAEAAGISRPALYLLFNKKEDVFRSVVRHNSRQRLEEVRQAISSSPKSVRDKLQLAFEIWSVKPFDMLKNSEEAEELLDCLSATR